MNETKKDEQLVAPEGKQAFHRSKPRLTAREVIELGENQELESAAGGPDTQGQSAKK